MGSRIVGFKTLFNQPLTSLLLMRTCKNPLDNLIVNSNDFSTSSIVCLNFYNKLPAEKLWKSVTSVSNAGAKKGRGRAGKTRVKDLNRGQMIGVGKINMLWPGLSAPVIRGREVMKQQRLPDDPERMQNIIKLRDSMTKFKRIKLSPLERGWSGGSLAGSSIGPPDPVGDDNFVGFDTKVLQVRSLALMKGTLGRTRNVHTLVVTGNGQGLVGFGYGRAKTMSVSLRKAKNRAGKKLMHFELYNGHTIFHDFFSQFGTTKILVQQKNKGFGLLYCHRVIREICRMIGIKDLRAKVESRNTNPQHLVKAFLLGLLQQKTHQQLAEEKKLHLVEYRAENNYYPTVVASPSYVRTKEEIPKDEILDFEQYVLNGKVLLRKKKPARFYQTMPHYEIYLRKREKYRNHEKIRLNLRTEYGEIKSFLSDKYPVKDEEKEA